MEITVEELRPPTALRLLSIWRESGDPDGNDPERGLVCNARVLAESCYTDGTAVFENAEAVLSALTPRQMEALLRRLAGEEPLGTAGGSNPRFDVARYAALREG